MSDALTDISRDERRGARVSHYYAILVEWLKDQTEEKAAEVRKAAEDADSVSGGYFSGGTLLSDHLEGRMKQLAANDELVWVDTISDLEPFCAGPFIELSPFKGKTLILYKQSYAPSVYRGGRECRTFRWEWNETGDHIGDNGWWKSDDGETHEQH